MRRALLTMVGLIRREVSTMSSPMLDGAVLLGVQRPRIESLPEGAVDWSAGEGALDYAELAGVESMDWQQHVVRQGMAHDGDGRWAAAEVGVLVARQNGKTAGVEIVELGWMMDEPGVSILHTAHEYPTAMKSLDRLEAMFRGHPLLEKQLKRVVRSHGIEAIELRNGSTIRYRTRTKGGARGFSVDRLVVDEAMIFAPASLAAIRPLMTTSRNPQIWYLGSAPDAEEHQHCHIWAALHRRGERGGDKRLCWLEWSTPEPPPAPAEWSPAYEAQRDAWRRDRSVWAAANPSLGVLITEDYIDSEIDSFAAALRKWEIERLSYGDWPPEQGQARTPVLSVEEWDAMTGSSALTGPVAIGVERHREFTTIVAARRTAGGRVALEVGYHDRPTAAVVGMLADLATRWDACAIAMLSTSPATGMVPALAEAKVEPQLISSTTFGAACVDFLDAARAGRLEHTGDPRLADAVQGVDKRDMSGGRFGWDFDTQAAIGPLIAATLARWALETWGQIREEPAAPSFTATVRGHEFDPLSAGF